MPPWGPAWGRLLKTGRSSHRGQAKSFYLEHEREVCARPPSLWPSLS